jgi:hypothetical protein
MAKIGVMIDMKGTAASSMTTITITASMAAIASRDTEWRGVEELIFWSRFDGDNRSANGITVGMRILVAFPAGLPCRRLASQPIFLERNIMNMTISLVPIVSLVAGILILVVPRLLNFIVAIYLIVIGLVGLFGSGHFLR